MNKLLGTARGTKLMTFLAVFTMGYVGFSNVRDIPLDPPQIQYKPTELPVAAVQTDFKLEKKRQEITTSNAGDDSSSTSQNQAPIQNKSTNSENNAAKNSESAAPIAQTPKRGVVSSLIDTSLDTVEATTSTLGKLIPL